MPDDLCPPERTTPPRVGNAEDGWLVGVRAWLGPDDEAWSRVDNLCERASITAAANLRSNNVGQCPRSSISE